MAIRTRQEILDSISSIVGESTDDNTLTLIEDITDTLTDFENKTNDNTNWKEKFETNDREWRERYKQRFYSNEETASTTPTPETTQDSKEAHVITSFDDLFK